jgi:hypothetical protein
LEKLSTQSNYKAITIIIFTIILLGSQSTIGNTWGQEKDGFGRDSSSIPTLASMTNSLSTADKQFPRFSPLTGNEVPSNLSDLPVATDESLARNDSAIYDEDLPLADSPASRSEKYQVRVQIHSLTMHNDHDPKPKGKGEIENYAYIQGHRAILNTHIDSGDTKFFEPPREVTVYLGANSPLSIFTVGIETDFCHTGASLAEYPPEYLTKLNPLFGNPASNWLEAISNVQKEVYKDYLYATPCDDKVGTINRIYEPTNYQEGPHIVKSSSGDFTLRFTVTVTPVQP